MAERSNTLLVNQLKLLLHLVLFCSCNLAPFFALTMSNQSKEPLAFVTGVDDKCVFVWSSEHPLEELRFPVKLGAPKPQLGQKVQYVCSKSPQEVQYGGVLKKVDSALPVIIQHDGELVVVAHVGFPPPGSNYCLRELAMAEDYHIRFYCHSVEMGTVVSFRDWDYNWQKVYQVHLKRFPKHCDWMISRVSSMWRICDMKEITDPAKEMQISSLMPWKNSFQEDDALVQSLSALDFDQENIANFHIQSTSQMAFSSEPLISIEGDSSQNNVSNYNLTDQRLLSQTHQRATNAVNIQLNSNQQQQHQIIDLADNDAPSRREFISGFNDFDDLMIEAKPNDMVPNFGIVERRQTNTNVLNEPQPSLCSTTRASQIDRSGSTRFADFGMCVAKVLSKTPQNRIGEAIQLKREIFVMCANKQNELTEGNV